jgi:hypothetical protein
MAGMKTKVPQGSKRLIRCMSVMDVVFTSALLGILKKKIVKMRVTAPMGKLTRGTSESLG